MHKQVEGDVTITARVTSLTGLSGFGLAGPMIRADLNPCGFQGSALLNVGHAAIFNCRRNSFPGSSCATKVDIACAVPGWLRGARAGDVVKASFSTNGTT